MHQVEVGFPTIEGLILGSSCHGIRVSLSDVSDPGDQEVMVQRQFLEVLQELLLMEQELKRAEALTSNRTIRNDLQMPGVMRRRHKSHASDYVSSDFVSLVSSWIHQNIRLQQVRVETSSSGSEAMLFSIIKSEEGAQLQGVRLSLPKPNLVTLLGTLSAGPSNLVRASFHVKTLQLSGVTAVADCIKTSAIEELFIEGVDRLANDSGEPLPTSHDDLNEQESSLLLDMSSLIAGSLRSNRHLRSFRLTGRNRLEPFSSQNECLRVFAEMMITNTCLESFHFAWLHSMGEDISSRAISMYLKLNRFGLRKRLHKSHQQAAWLNAIIKFNGWRSHGIDCTYYLLRGAPWLCAC